MNMMPCRRTENNTPYDKAMYIIAKEHEIQFTTEEEFYEAMDAIYEPEEVELMIEHKVFSLCHTKQDYESYRIKANLHLRNRYKTDLKYKAHQIYQKGYISKKYFLRKLKQELEKTNTQNNLEESDKRCVL